MGNCACTKDNHQDDIPKKSAGGVSKLQSSGNNPEILAEAIDDENDPAEEADEMPDTCENLLRPNKKISLSDFELIKVIGRGSFGKVYLVKRNGTQNYYAMKKLKKEVVAKRNLFIKT